MDQNEHVDPSLNREPGRIGPGVSPEHRAILETALAEPVEHSLFSTLASMPNVGSNSDFERNRG
jgi:hypothetical protein